MATIFATNSGNSLSPVCTTRKLLQAVQNCFRWIGMGLVLSKRFADDSLNYPFLMGNVGAHTYIYAQGLPFACNLKEKRGKGGLVPPNNRFERTRGTSPLAAQPNVEPKISQRDVTMSKAKARTIQQRLGFMDNDLKTSKHDEIMLWLDTVVQKHLGELIGFEQEWKLRDFYVTEKGKEFRGEDKEFYFNDIQLPKKPELEVTKCIWEYPITTGKDSYIVGFADMKVDFMDTILNYNADDRKFSIFKNEYSVFFEAKSSILSLGELIRQIRMYQTYTRGKWFVVSPDVKFSTALESQEIFHIEYNDVRFAPDEAIGPDGTIYKIP